MAKVTKKKVSGKRIKVTLKQDTEAVIVPLNKIIQSDNSRLKYQKEDMTELMVSIKDNGVLQPVGLKPVRNKKGYFKLVWGNRRFLAVQKLGWSEIKGVIKKDLSSEEELILNLVENIHRKDLTEFEKGRYFSELKNKGLTISEISAKVGCSLVIVKRGLNIFEQVDPKYRKMIVSLPGGPNAKKGKISGKIAERILNLKRKFPKVTKKQTNKLLDKLKLDSISNEHVAHLMAMMNDKVPFEKAVKRMDEIEVLRLDIPILKKEANAIRNKLKKGNISLSSCGLPKYVSEQIYAGKKIKFTRPS